MRRRTAKEILAESFREIAKKKRIDKITIKDITDESGYSSATFYRSFKDKYDLIAWDHAHSVLEIMNQIDDKNYSWKQTLLDGSCYFYNNRNYLSNLLLHTSGHDSFVRYMIDINYDILEKYILQSAKKTVLDKQIKLYIRIYCIGTVNLTCEWILGKYKLSPEELADIYLNSLPLPLHPYLL